MNISSLAAAALIALACAACHSEQTRDKIDGLQPDGSENAAVNDAAVTANEDQPQ